MVNIPLAPGVPSVIGAIGDIVTLLSQDAVSLLVGLINPPWGIYLDGIRVVNPDNVVSFSFKQEEAILDFPVEGGNFESYGKVHIPFDVRLRFSTGGNQASRQAFIDSVRAIIGDTNIYDVVTPNNVYLGLNVVHMEYVQGAGDGLGLIIMDVWLLQVRVAASALITSVLNPSIAAQVNGGVVQAISALSSQQSLLPIITSLF